MGGLPRRNVTIPLTQGLGGETSRYLRTPERLEEAVNVRAPKAGGLGTRYGFTSQGSSIFGGSTSIAAQGPIRALGTTHRELLAVGHRTLYAYNPLRGAWLARGHVSPCVGTTEEVFRGFARYYSADCAATTQSGYMLYAAHRHTSDYGGVNTHSLEFRGRMPNGDTTLAPTSLTGSTTSDHIWGPRMAPYDSLGVATIAGEGALSGAGDLHLYTYSAANMTTSPALASTITSNLHIGAFPPSYDIITMADDGVLIAWIDATSQDVELRRYDSALSQQASATVSGTFMNAVALADSAGDNIYLLTVSDTGETVGELVAYCRRRADLAAVWGPVVLYTSPGGTDAITQLGLVEGDDGADLRVRYTWRNADGSLNSSNTHFRSSDTSGGTLDTDTYAYNTESVVRPVFYRDRCYQHVMTHYPDADGFKTHMLVDAGYNDPSVRQPRLAALHGFGEAATPFLQVGVQSHAVWSADATLRYMAPFLGEKLKGSSDSRDAYDEVKQQFDAPVSICEGPRGTAVIGGGYVAWYDGTQTFELGFASPPIIEDTAQTGSGTNPTTGTYAYNGVWEFFDAAGILHRSVPGPSSSETLASASNVTVDVYSLPCSRRDELAVTCQLFRSGADAVPRRLNASNDILKNNTVAMLLASVTDSKADSSLLVPLYTVGGVLEAATPEGAQVVRLIRERLWAGRFYRSDRVQFSKLTTPGTSGETAISPEFFEALSRLMERGERVTGLAFQKGATVILTTRGIYLVGGYGPDDRGLGDDMSRLTRLLTDEGCQDFRSVVEGPDGVYYLGRRGINLLTEQHQVTPVGEPARDLLLDFPVCTSAVLVPEETQVRFTLLDADPAFGAPTDSRIAVYDYRIGEWFEWQPLKASGPSTAPILPAGATYLDGTYYLTESHGVTWYEDTSTHLDDATIFVPVTIETGEIQPPGPQSHWRLGKVSLLAEYKDDLQITVGIAKDYAAATTTEATWTNAQIVALADAASRLQLSRRPRYQRGQSQRVRITTAENGTVTSGEGAVFHALTCEVGIYGGLPRAESGGKS